MKKISMKSLVELTYANLSKIGFERISVEEIINIALVLKEAPKFSKYKNIIKDSSLTYEDIRALPYTLNIDGDNNIEFYISEEDSDKVIEKYGELSEICSDALDYALTCEAIGAQTEGKAYCNLSSSDGVYRIGYYNNGISKEESAIFTDGNVKVGTLNEDEEDSLLYLRNLTIRDSTYSFFVEYLENNIKSIIVRNQDIGNNGLHIMEEIKNITAGRVSHYEKLSDSPKVYRLYKN